MRARRARWNRFLLYIINAKGTDASRSLSVDAHKTERSDNPYGTDQPRMGALGFVRASQPVRYHAAASRNYPGIARAGLSLLWSSAR